uniref:Pentacotripeptide-repeat region of PRORP domain-containing protein n=2 Tax=Aegilops tauschii subsp. strangulata TaxID=200361 RepID=A0A452XVW9_AEGTS
HSNRNTRAMRPCRTPLLDSTSPLSVLLLDHLHRNRPSPPPSASPPSAIWSPIAAFAAATKRARAGTLSPEDAHHLFDELLRQSIPVPNRFLNGFLAALARAPASEACGDGPALTVALFNRLCREEAGPCVEPPTYYTYSILMDSCCRVGRPDLGLAFFGRLLKSGLKADQITASSLLMCLCDAGRTNEAVDVLLHRISELGCEPNVIPYNIVLKSLCDSSRSQRALDLLQMMAQRACRSPNVVSYNTVIQGLFKEGQVSMACTFFFYEMMGLCLMW